MEIWTLYTILCMVEPWQEQKHAELKKEIEKIGYFASMDDRSELNNGGGAELKLQRNVTDTNVVMINVPNESDNGAGCGRSQSIRDDVYGCNLSPDRTPTCSDNRSRVSNSFCRFTSCLFLRKMELVRP